ncbi:MAG: hypothetical protein ACOC2W_04935, partial [bacterium]
NHKRFVLDSVAPKIPRMKTKDIVSNNTQINFSWKESKDSLTGIIFYEIIITENNTIFLAQNITQTTFSYDNFEENKTYYAKVRAYDYALNPSRFSDEIQRDTKPPILSKVRPTGHVSSLKPKITLFTDEKAICEYKQISPERKNNSPFYYTNSTYHEIIIPGQHEQGTYTYKITCTDSAQNIASKTIEFKTTSNQADQIQIHELDSYFVNEIIDIKINLTTTISSQSKGISHAQTNNFKIKIDNKYLDDLTIDDLGEGIYSLKFIYDKPGKFAFNIYYKNLTTQSRIINISNIPVSITYDEEPQEDLGGLSAQEISSQSIDWDLSKLFSTDEKRITYFDKNRSVIGIGTDSTPIKTNNTDKSMTLTANANDGNQYIFITKETTEIEKREKFLKRKNFLDLMSPSFGQSIDDNVYNIRALFKYPGIKIFSPEITTNASLTKGKYNIVIINKGYDENGKKLIEIKLT